MVEFYQDQDGEIDVPQERETSMFRQHGFEILKTGGMVFLSVFVGIASYVWNSTITRIEAEMAYHRKYIDILDERLRLMERGAEGSRALDLSLSQRLDRLEELNYGYTRRKQ